MKIIRGIRNIKEKINAPVLTLGNFDGVHVGHMDIFHKIKERAARIGGTSVVYTFEPHPLKVLYPGNSPYLLTTFHKKMELIRGCGMDMVICADFNRRFASLCPRDFARDILSKRIGAREVFVGADYTFGRQKEGTIRYLEKMGDEFGFAVRVVDPVTINGTQASSSLARLLVEEGRVAEAAEVLGRHYSIEGRVVEGFKTGAAIGYPTANLDPLNELVPGTGIYAVVMTIQGGSHPGVTNIGFNPTFKRDRMSIETHLFDFDLDIYSEDVELFFIERIRDEREFSSTEELVVEIGRDIRRAKEMLKGLGAGGRLI